MSNVTNTEVDTRPAAGKDAITTKLAIDWEGMTLEETRALAQQALIVKLQGGWRKNGIPAECNVKATDHRVGARAPRSKLSVLDQIKALSPEQRAAILAELAG